MDTIRAGRFCAASRSCASSASDTSDPVATAIARGCAASKEFLSAHGAALLERAMGRRARAHERCGAGLPAVGDIRGRDEPGVPLRNVLERHFGPATGGAHETRAESGALRGRIV